MAKTIFDEKTSRYERIKRIVSSSSQDTILDLYWEFFGDDCSFAWEVYHMEMVDYMFDELDGMGDAERTAFLAEQGIDERHRYWSFDGGSSDSLYELMGGYSWWIRQMVDEGADIVEDIAPDGKRTYTVVRDVVPDDVTNICIGCGV